MYHLDGLDDTFLKAMALEELPLWERTDRTFRAMRGGKKILIAQVQLGGQPVVTSSSLSSNLTLPDVLDFCTQLVAFIDNDSYHLSKSYFVPDGVVSPLTKRQGRVIGTIS